jgi:hypothetical protein
MSWCPEEASHENEDRLELDIQDEEYCNPIYSPTFTRHEMDYDEQYSSEQHSQEHNENENDSTSNENDSTEEDTPQTDADARTYTNDTTNVLSFFSCFSPAARPRTASMASATSDSSVDLSVTSTEDESSSVSTEPQSAVEPTAATSGPDAEASSPTEHKCKDEAKDKKAPKATKGRGAGAKAATKRKQSAAAAATAAKGKAKQAVRAKKRKVVESSPEPVVRMHTSRSGRRVRMHKAY